jgi:hypothetical protein
LVDTDATSAARAAVGGQIRSAFTRRSGGRVLGETASEDGEGECAGFGLRNDAVHKAAAMIRSVCIDDDRFFLFLSECGHARKLRQTATVAY